MISDYTESEQRAFFVENAARFYRLPPALWQGVT
jgi:predicted TIM-barrel fold metal-dependent hydrolase